MTKKCLIEIYGVRLILKYDKTIVLEDVLSTLSKKCNLKTQLSGVTYYDLMIELVNWNKEEHFDRLGTKKDPNNIRIPIKKGRDVGILIEVAVLDYKLRKNGEDYSKIFNKEIYKQINNKLEQIRVLDNTKDNLETVKSKIKSCEELDLEFLLNLGVD